MCIIICSTLTEQYGDRMAAAFHRQDVIGWIARCVLQSPETIFEYHKDIQGAPPAHVERHLPPRISLRLQASKRVCIAFSLGMVPSSFGAIVL